MTTSSRAVLVPGLGLVIAVACGLASACTLWCAVGSATKDSVTLVAKNRDWNPRSKQVLRKVRAPKSGFGYFGIYAEDSDAPGFKAGINERGLVVVNASASSIPARIRHSVAKKNLMKALLSGYAGVAEVLRNEKIFASSRPMFYLLADKQSAAVVEVSIDGKYSIRTQDNGVLYHTNHYTDSSLASGNVKIGKSSRARLARISDLLSERGAKFSLDDFAAIGADTVGGPDKAIWRTGSKSGSEKTIASWIALLPTSGPATVRVKLVDPGEPVKQLSFTIDEEFWRK